MLRAQNRKGYASFQVLGFSGVPKPDVCRWPLPTQYSGHSDHLSALLINSPAEAGLISVTPNWIYFGFGAAGTADEW